MTALANISAPVSFGLDVRRPGLLETRSTGDVLLDIQSGAWQEAGSRQIQCGRRNVGNRKQHSGAQVDWWAGSYFQMTGIQTPIVPIVQPKMILAAAVFIAQCERKFTRTITGSAADIPAEDRRKSVGGIHSGWCGT